MTSVSLFLGEGLRPLADQLLATLGAGSPLSKRTIVVPSPQVGQWLEQYVATQWGAIANWDILLVDPFLASVLYEDPSSFDAWGTLALTGQLLALRGDTPLSVTSATARARNLREVMLWRPERLDDYLANIDQQLEARVVQQLRTAGAASPWDAVQTAPARATGEVVLFGLRELAHGALLPAVVGRVAQRANVQIFLTMPSLDEAVTSNGSLIGTWGATQFAHLQMWRTHLPQATITNCPDHARVLRSVLGGSAVVEVDDIHAALELHGAVGPGRQVEVARDVIARLIAELNIAPHEVRVVTTDPYQFAPLFDAEWRHQEANRQSLQFEVADPSLARASFRLEAFTRLLRTMQSHFTVNDFVTLLSEPALLAGLAIESGDAERLRELAVEAMSMGLDADTRSSLGVFDSDDDSGTWQRFSDRGLLATVFEPTRSHRASILPLGVADDLEPMAAVAELSAFLLEALNVITESHPLSTWLTWLRTIADRFIGFVPDVTDNGLEKVLGRLEGVAKESNPTLNFTEVVEIVESVANSLGGGQTFGRGGVVVQGLDGLADAPYAVTCILGLDEDLIPSPASPPAHLAPAHPGDPSQRSRFRTSLLAQILSTTHRVVLFTTDRSVRDSSPVGLSVPLAELDAALRPTLGHEGLGIRRHPRHGFSINIESDKVESDVTVDAATAFSLDAAHAAIATKLALRINEDLAPESDAPSASSSVDAPETIDISELRRFIRDPQARYAAKFLGNARMPRTIEEVGRTPRRSLTKHIEIPSIKRDLVREGLDQGTEEMDVHLDDLVNLVATAFRSDVEKELGREILEHFVAYHRHDLELLDVLPSVIEGPAEVSFGERVRPLMRAGVEVYELADEVVIVRTTTSSRLESAFLPGVLDLSVATLATDKPVRLVVVRPADTTDAAGNAWVQLKWPAETAPANAAAAIAGFAKIYDSQYAHPPVFVRRTSLHALAAAATPHKATLGKLFKAKKPHEMWDGGFGKSSSEKDDPINKLLLPFDFNELQSIYNSSFSRIIDHLAKIVTPLVITVNQGSSSWRTGVEADDAGV